MRGRWRSAALLAGLCACDARTPEPAPVSAEAVVPIAMPSAATRLVDVPGGTFRPLFGGKDAPKAVAVAPFRMDEHPVTNAQFLGFVAANPQWRRSRVGRLMADRGYLGHWRGDLELAPDDSERPVTHVSWFAARAYARWIGRRLPALAEWELAAAMTPEDARRVLEWYGRPSAEPPSTRGAANALGIRDLHGVVWEWVEDWNSALVTGESRGDSARESQLFCGAGVVGAADPSDYAAFMRFAFRSSLEGAYCVKNLGFRCAADADEGRLR